MITCPKYNLQVNEETECIGKCIFCLIYYDNGNRKVQCQFNEWYPGLKQGREIK